jgi:hypothetical protein
MKVTIEINDSSEIVDGKEVPFITMDIKSDESVDGMTEPTPAMWTGSYIYELFISGMLIQMVRDYIVLKDQQANAQAEQEEAESV